MNDIVKTYQERFRRNRHNFRRYAALLLALAMITTLFVNWQLHGVGISMTADYQCGEIEHTHTADCYEKVLICPYTEGEPEDGTVVSEPVAEEPAADTGIAVYNAEPEYIFVPHEHTDDCYTEVKSLTCSEEEHIHNDDCFDPEDGSLICDKFEHTHDEDCYTTERELTCGLEEGELVEELNPDYTPVATFEAPVAQTPVVVEPVAETPVHHHTDACYEEVLVCPLPEHQHTVNCLSDQTADIEDEGEWLAATDTTLGSSWAENLLAVAQSQLGYEQSEKNFKLETDEYNDDVVRHYTRYGQWYGNPYGEWDMMFLSYCLHYAEIPQSVVPQTAGVLALRSAMNNNGTALLQDVDSRTVAVQDADSADAGTTIAPGDIVIYSKNKMETVVWEQSEPTTDPSDSGIALYSSGFVPSGPVVADDDFVAPTDPTPVYTTKTTTVETAGIVESVDSKRGTVTVISGDVEGKVDTLELSLAQVQSVISMTTAQAVNNGTSVQGSTELKEDWITDTTITVDGKTYVIKEKRQYNKDLGDLTVTDESNVTLEYQFSIDGASANGTNQLTYDLPAGLITAEGGASGVLEDSKDHVIGRIDVSENGKATLTFNSPLTGQTSGHFKITCKVDQSSATNKSEIKFPGDGASIPVKSLTDLGVKKAVTSKGLDSDGYYTLHYKVTVYSDHGSGETINLSDYITLNSDYFSDFSYSNVTLDGKTLPSADYKYTTDTSQSGKTGIIVTTANDNPLPALSGKDGNKSKYTLEYDVKCKKIKQGAVGLDNTAYANNESGPGKYYFQDEFNKGGSYDPNTGLIIWTITITPNGTNLDGYKFVDNLPTGIYLKGNLVLKDNGNQELDRVALTEGGTSINYTFSKDKLGDTPAYQYTLTYTTTAPTNFGPNKSISNTALIELNGNKKWEDTGNADYRDRSQTSTKSALTNTKLDSANANGTIFTLPWSLSTDVPHTWNTSVVEIKDKIIVPSNGGDHYAVLGTLKKEIEDNLLVTCEDGTTFKYANFETKGLNLDMRFYSSHDYSGAQLSKDSTDEHVGSFILHFSVLRYTGTPIKNITIQRYTTLGDYSGVAEEKKVTFRNESVGTSAEYYYTTPGSTEKKLTKMVAAEAPDSPTSAGSYKEDGKKVTVSYGNGYGPEYGSDHGDKTTRTDGTYIYYQLKLFTGFPLNLGTYTTITDTLPENTTLVDDSIYVVAISSNGEHSNGQRQYFTNVQWYEDGDTNKYRVNDLNSDKFLTVDKSSDGRTVKFTLSQNFNYLKYPANADVEGLLIRYAVKVDDSIWDYTQKEQTFSFHNSAKWEGVNGSDTTTKVKYESKLVIKDGKYDELQNRVHYSLIINPDRLELGTDETITLTDTLKANDSLDNTAQLVRSSVKLYDYDAKTKTVGAEIPLGVWGFDYLEDLNSSKDRNVYTFKVTVPNKHSYLLKYDYKNTSDTSYAMENSAELSGYKTETVTKKVKNIGVSGGADSVGLTIEKVDSKNSLIALPDATFQLQWFNPSSKEYENVQTITTDSNGKFTLSFSNASDRTPYYDDDSGTWIRPYNILYKLTEFKAPDGYRTNTEWALYFIWTTDATNQTNAYNHAVGSAAANIEVDPSKIKYYYGDASVTLQMKNESSRLSFVKQWYDKDNHVIDGKSDTLPVKITLELWRRPNKDNMTDAQKVTDINLEKSENWSGSYTIANDHYADWYYYVKEVNSGRNYKVDYIGNDVQHDGTIVITNTETEDSGYELPSTGGAGTTPFTAVGGTMMLAALVYGVRRKRRRKGGAAD